MAARKLIRLNHIHMAGIRARMALIEQKQREAQALIEQRQLEIQLLRDGLSKYIEDQLGVNLSTQDWTLDLEHALLERQPTARKQTSGSDN